MSEEGISKVVAEWREDAIAADRDGFPAIANTFRTCADQLAAMQATGGEDYPVYVDGPNGAGAFCLHSNCEEMVATLAASYRNDPEDYTATRIDLQYLCNVANDEQAPTPPASSAPVAWQEQVADALEMFWNASLNVTHQSNDATANAVMGGMVEGFAAMARRLRENAHPPQPAPASSGGGGLTREEVEALERVETAAKQHGTPPETGTYNAAVDTVCAALRRLASPVQAAGRIGGAP